MDHAINQQISNSSLDTTACNHSTSSPGRFILLKQFCPFNKRYNTPLPEKYAFLICSVKALERRTCVRNPNAHIHSNTQTSLRKPAFPQ